MPEKGGITMNNIFAYDFMIRALITAVLIGIISPCIGTTVVLKRLSAIGDAISHSALAGIAAGLMIGIHPVLGAVIFSVLAVLGIELMRKGFRYYSEIATAVIMSSGIGLTALLSGFVGSSTDLNSFMFGSIVAISDFELILTIALSITVILTTMILYRELFFIAFDEDAAVLAGVPVKAVNLVIMLLTAVTVSVASRVVGALMISSLLVIPAACSMLISRSYKQTIILSVIFAEIFTISGLIASFYLNLRPGGSIVIIGVATLVIIMIISKRK